MNQDKQVDVHLAAPGGQVPSAASKGAPCPEHTPGPWRLRETDAMFYIDGEPTEKPRRTYILQRDKRYQSKAYVTRTRADCLLIAAAPALLDAVRRLLPKPFTGNPTDEELIAFWKRERGLGRAEADDVLAAYAAIAIATGSAA